MLKEKKIVQREPVADFQSIVVYEVTFVTFGITKRL